MEKAIPLILLVSLALCCCAQEQKSEWIDNVPSDSILAVKFDSTIWKDKDLQEFYQTTTRNSYEDAKSQLEKGGINPDEIRRVIVWYSGDTSRGYISPTSFAYLIEGGFDKKAILEGDACSSGCEETEYKGYTVYKSFGNAFAFIDSYLVIGSLKGVEKTLDVKAGDDKGSREEMKALLNEVEERAIVGVFLIPETAKEQFLSGAEVPVSTEDFYSVENLAFSADKEGENLVYTIAIECRDSSSAEKVKDGLEAAVATIEDMSAQEQSPYSNIVKLFTEGTSFKTEGKFVKVDARISINEIESNIEKMLYPQYS